MRSQIGVVGLGYVGPPLCCAPPWPMGSPGTGFDVDRGKVDVLNAGAPYIRYISAESIAALPEAGS